MKQITKINVTLCCFLIILTTLDNLILETQARTCLFSEEFEIHVVNTISPSKLPMSVHCQSKDNDLGTRSLAYKGDYNWTFCSQLFGRTLFFCNLKWDKKSITFDAFNSTTEELCGDSGSCYWASRTDGIYFSANYPQQDLKKSYSW